MSGVVTEEDADNSSEAEGNQNRERRYESRPAQYFRNQDGQRTAYNHAYQAAHQAQDERFGQELHPHVIGPGSDRHTDADFASSFCDGYQHDVHDSNSTDDQRNRGDTAE